MSTGDKCNMSAYHTVLKSEAWRQQGYRADDEANSESDFMKKHNFESNRRWLLRLTTDPPDAISPPRVEIKLA